MFNARRVASPSSFRFLLSTRRRLCLRGATCSGVRPGPTGDDVLRLYATARLMLGRDIPNLQASWVKEGLRTSQLLLSCGVNDLGGTLMNESISTAAGARHGQLMTPATLRRVIRDAGRAPGRAQHRRMACFTNLEIHPIRTPRSRSTPIQDPDQVVRFLRRMLTRDSRFHYEPRGLRVVS